LRRLVESARLNHEAEVERRQEAEVALNDSQDSRRRFMKFVADWRDRFQANKGIASAKFQRQFVEAATEALEAEGGAS
jgi:cyclopropane fatty-acyl-phospholipid synthase-like methyltransferase